MSSLSHLDAQGHARMVDVTGKDKTSRKAIARGMVFMEPQTLEMIAAGNMPKGDVFAVARIAGIMAAKQVPSLIPLCHGLALSSVKISFSVRQELSAVEIEAEVKVNDRTGVEMEALTATSIAALTLYDMCKAVDKGMIIKDIRLTYKDGGKSGLYEAQ